MMVTMIIYTLFELILFAIIFILLPVFDYTSFTALLFGLLLLKIFFRFAISVKPVEMAVSFNHSTDFLFFVLLVARIFQEEALWVQQTVLMYTICFFVPIFIENHLQAWNEQKKKLAESLWKISYYAIWFLCLYTYHWLNLQPRFLVLGLFPVYLATSLRLTMMLFFR